MARDAGYVFAGAVHRKIRHLEEAEQISLRGARSLSPWRAIRQLLAHEPFRRARSVTADLAKLNTEQAISVRRTASTLTKLRNADIAR
jgi:hypothetical protein